MKKIIQGILALPALGITTAFAAEDAIELVVESETVLEVIGPKIAEAASITPISIPASGSGIEIIIFAVLIAGAYIASRHKLAQRKI